MVQKLPVSLDFHAQKSLEVFREITQIITHYNSGMQNSSSEHTFRTLKWLRFSRRISICQNMSNKYLIKQSLSGCLGFLSLASNSVGEGTGVRTNITDLFSPSRKMQIKSHKVHSFHKLFQFIYVYVYSAMNKFAMKFAPFPYFNPLLHMSDL